MAEENKYIYRLKVETDDARSSMKGLEVKIQELIRSFKDLEKGTTKYEAAQAKLAVLQNKYIKSSENYANAIRRQKAAQDGLIGDGTQGLTGASMATGAATSATLELGRAISDAPYGIRGMANNVSQLASNIFFMSKKVDEATGKTIGFMGSIRQIGRGLLGSAGVLVAIQAVIAAVDYFSSSTSKATDEVDNLNNSLDEQISKFNMLSDFLNQDRVEIIDRLLGGSWEDDLKVLNNEFSEFRKKYESLSDEDKKDQELVKNLSIQYKKLLGIKSEITKDTERLRELQEDGVEKGEIEGLKNKIKTNYILKASIEELFEVEKKQNKEQRKNLRTYKQNLLDQQKIRSELEKDERLSREQNEIEKLKISQKYEREQLDIDLNLFIEKERLRHEDFMRSKATDEAKKEATRLHNESILNAEKEHADTLNQMMITQSAERLSLALQLSREYNDAFITAQQEGGIITLQGRVNLDTGVDSLKWEEELNRKMYDNKIYWLNEEIKRRKEAKEEFADLERQKANETERYENEKLGIVRKTEKAKRDVVLMGLDVVRQVAGEGSAVGKAAGVAMATISTYEAATAALGAKPYGPWNIAQAAAVTAMGLANVKKILDTKIPEGGGSVSGANITQGREFDFNLVGSTGQNQLASIVGGQIQNPIRAYVVSSEITNQQALDNQIQGSATIGD